MGHELIPGQRSSSQCLTDAELRQIIAMSGLIGRRNPPDKKTCNAVVNCLGRKYKVRKYLTEEDAALQAELLNKCQDGFVKCFGAVGPYLVLEFLEGVPSEPNARTFTQIGTFLRRLAEVETEQEPPSQFEEWCQAIERAGIYSRPAVQLITRHYHALLDSSEVQWAIEYFDAMPRNFVSNEQGRLVSIDEKHLRIGPKGISLIKPKSQLSQPEVRLIEDAYGVQPRPAEQHFLEFYHLVFSLGFYAFRDRRINSRVCEFHTRRRRLLCLINAPRYIRVREELPWRWRRYFQTVQRNVFRIVRYIRRTLYFKATASGAPDPSCSD